jgi:hypothetical protein
MFKSIYEKKIKRVFKVEIGSECQVMWGVLARREGLNAMRDEGRAGPLGGRAG